MIDYEVCCSLVPEGETVTHDGCRYQVFRRRVTPTGFIRASYGHVFLRCERDEYAEVAGSTMVCWNISDEDIQAILDHYSDLRRASGYETL